MNLAYIFYSRPIYTTLPLSVYSRVLGYFWLSRLKPKKPKKHKKPKKTKKIQISNLKNHWFFPPLIFRDNYYLSFIIVIVISTFFRGGKDI